MGIDTCIKHSNDTDNFESEIRTAERNLHAAEDAVEQARLDRDAAIQRLAEINLRVFSQDEASIMEAVVEIGYGSGNVHLADVLARDDAELGRRMRVAILNWLAQEAVRAAEKEVCNG